MRTTGWLFGLVAAVLLAAGCGDDDDDVEVDADADAKPGKLNIFVTDDPFPSQWVESATVEISAVEVHDPDSDGWTEVFAGPVEIDLVPLTGGVAQLIADATLPPGTYDQVRLIVGGGEVVLEEEAFVDGDDHVFNSENGNMLFPSGAQTGIKVHIDPAIVVVTELSADLILDVDLAKSFVFNGPPDHAPGVRRVLFKPVVRAVNASTSGRAVLDVLTDNGTPADTADDDPLAGATVTALDDLGDEVGSAVADAQGHVEIVLPPGTYDLLVEAANHTSQTVEDVEIFLANATPVPVVTLAATTVTIHGTVMGDEGVVGDTTDDLPLADVTVTATPSGGGTPVATATAADGTYSLALAPGSYDLTFVKTDYVSGSANGVVGTVAGTVVDITLTPEP